MKLIQSLTYYLLPLASPAPAPLSALLDGFAHCWNWARKGLPLESITGRRCLVKRLVDPGSSGYLSENITASPVRMYQQLSVSADSFLKVMLEIPSAPLA